MFPVMHPKSFLYQMEYKSVDLIFINDIWDKQSALVSGWQSCLGGNPRGRLEMSAAHCRWSVSTLLESSEHLRKT